MGITLNIKDLVPKWVVYISGRYANDKLFDQYSLKVWKNLITTLVQNNSSFNSWFKKDLPDCRSMRRLLYSQFHLSKELTIESLVYTVGVEALEAGELKDNEKRVIQFSQALTTKWYSEMLDNNILKERFETKMGKKVTMISPLNKNVEAKLFEILKDPKELRREFYRTYSSENVTDDKFRVFLPNAQGYLDWKGENSIVISLNTFETFELGFFRIGYDYHLLDSNLKRKAHVRRAALSKDMRKEVANFSDGETFGNKIEDSRVIWMA
ncbi:hypothetical protein [Paenibacillus tepidiphilus]|uniref:hypothetical protein n=1 Tax=Paenibacillus tepidiphilus TaxID=2608683 RepID=UPI00123AA07F|nr:hypothetical protein [Paenibacillus tepidiphilus]